jgi:hypothetical protein
MFCEEVGCAAASPSDGAFSSGRRHGDKMGAELDGQLARLQPEKTVAEMTKLEDSLRRKIHLAATRHSSGRR